MKATYFALGRHQLRCWRASLGNLRHVKLVEVGAVDVAGGMKGVSSMGPWVQLRCMLGAVVFFHTSEFLLALAHHGRRRVNAASTLISGPYLVALALSMVEHALESRYVPWLKKQALVSYTGLAMVVVGEALRKLAVITANKSFTHDIKVDKRQEHKLVTHGIYSFFRHPSYLGFFIWSIGTQVLLVNPVCIVGYTIVTWRFFDHRIPYPYTTGSISFDAALALWVLLFNPVRFYLIVGKDMRSIFYAAFSDKIMWTTPAKFHRGCPSSNSCSLIS